MKTIKNKVVYEENINNLPAKALAIVFPESLQEIKTLVKLSDNDIIARGGGSSLTGATIPDNSIIVDFSKMNKIIDINPVKKTIKVEPGILLSELNEELEQYDLEFPIIPIFGGIETIGGMIAKNSLGNREIKYNRMMNWIDSLEIINGKGEQIKISKSDISDFVGLEGTTGLIISASLRLTNKKQRTLTILKANSLEEVFIANKKLRLNMDISSIDLINRELSSVLGLENKYHLFVEYETNEGSFKLENYDKFIKIKNKTYKRAATEGFFLMENAKFLVDSLPDFFIFLEEKKIPYFAHLASGVVYFMFKPDESQKREDALKMAKRLRAKIAYASGTGLSYKQFLDIGEKDLIRRVKKRQDPHGKFNMEKLLDSSFEGKPRALQEVKKEPEQIEESDISLEEAMNEKIIEENNTPIQQKQTKPESQMTIAELIEQQNQQKELKTQIKKPESELSDEEREKIKKIAAGFFAGGRDSEDQKNNGT